MIEAPERGWVTATDALRAARALLLGMCSSTAQAMHHDTISKYVDQRETEVARLREALDGFATLRMNATGEEVLEYVNEAARRALEADDE